MDFFIRPNLMVFIAIFSNIAILTVPFNNAPHSPRPLRWNLKKLVIVSSILGIMLAGCTFIFHFATFSLHMNTQSSVFLEIALSQNWFIFSSRQQSSGPWYKTRPGWILILAALCIDFVATFFVKYPLKLFFFLML